MTLRQSLLRQIGFTLIEVIVVMVVLGIVATVGSRVLREGFLGYFLGREIAGADTQGRLAIERITRELATISEPNYSNIVASGCSSLPFTFSDTTATVISYTRSSTTLMRNGQPLADNVTGLAFRCLQDDGKTYSTAAGGAYYISVSMIVATTNTSAVYRSTIKPRGF